MMLRYALAVCALMTAAAPIRAAFTDPPAVPVGAAITEPSAVPIRGGTTPLSDIGLYAVRYRYFDGRSGEQPLGWTGGFDARTGIALEPAGVQDGKAAFLEHPIWRGGAGDTDQVFRLALPKAKRIVLRFSVALRADAAQPGKSDGVTFRVWADGDTLLDTNKTDAAWSDYEFDLTRYAGKAVALTFETDPGPKRDAGFDFALWGDRRIVVSGAPAAPLDFPAPRPEPPLTAFTVGWGGTSPTHAPRASGAPGIGSAASPSASSLLGGCRFLVPDRSRKGALQIVVPFGANASLDLVASDGSIVSTSDPAVRASVRQTREASGSVVREAVYTLGARTVTVHARVDPYDGGSVRMRVWSADPWIAAVRFGSVGPTAYRRAVAVPYLGTVDYHPELRLFSNTIVDFTRSHASALDGSAALYDPLTDGTRNTVDETAYYALSPSIHAVLPTPPGDPSPYRAEMGGCVVLDLWGEPFAQAKDLLDDYAGCGLTDFFTIVHVWQHGGYDNRLPDVLPAQESLGGDGALRALTAEAKRLKQRIALHENYVDFYPDAPSYDDADIARASDGSRIKAWLNLQQSYLMTPSAMSKYATRITPQVHAELGTNASYLDVHSAIPPWSHVDYRPQVPGAGGMRECWTDQRALWQLMRRVHGGPVLGEGANHWFWSGMLDGVEAQFGVGVSTGEGAPLFVDFDLMKIHPRQINHGMGYLERWLRPDHAHAVPDERQIDEYRMQEIAYGHSAFVGNILASRPAFVWQEHNLVLPASRACAAARAVAIDYEAGGRLLDTDDAVAAGTKFDRVRVRYDRGVTVWANARPSEWTVHAAGRAVTMPQYGWLVAGPGTLAYTGKIGGRTVDYAETPRAIFADARLAPATPVLGALQVAPSLNALRAAGPHRLQAAFAWSVHDTIPAGERVFVHITGKDGANEGIVAQMGSGIGAPPDTWPRGVTVSDPVNADLPENLPDGEYEIKVGLYDPRSGGRLALSGIDDGGHRYTVGKFRLSGGTVIPEGVAAAHREAPPAPLDFGKVATNGSVRLDRQAPGVWTLTPFPRDRTFAVRLDAASLDPAFRSGIHVAALGADGRVLRAVTVSNAGKWTGFAANLLPGAVSYRITAH